MNKNERDYIESVSAARGIVNALVISVLFWGAIITAAAALIGTLK